MLENNISNNNNSYTDSKKKKKKKDKVSDGDVTFDLHTILCCDTSFFNIPIEAYLCHMLNIHMINRDFSVNLLLHRLISQTHINNVSNDLENPVGNDDKPAKDKNKKNKKVGPTNPIDNGISQITNFNCKNH